MSYLNSPKESDLDIPKGVNERILEVHHRLGGATLPGHVWRRSHVPRRAAAAAASTQLFYRGRKVTVYFLAALQVGLQRLYWSCWW